MVSECSVLFRSDCLTSTLGNATILALNLTVYKTNPLHWGGSCCLHSALGTWSAASLSCAAKFTFAQLSCTMLPCAEFKCVLVQLTGCANTSGCGAVQFQVTRFGCGSPAVWGAKRHTVLEAENLLVVSC